MISTSFNHLMIRCFFAVIFASYFSCSHAQGLVQNGGYIVQTPGSNLIVNGNNGNYKSTGKSHIKLAPNSFFVVSNNWTNNGNSPVFVSNYGRVELRGINISIDGNNTTHFPDLNLSGNGNVGLFVNTLVGGGINGGGSGILRLNNTQLYLNSRTLIVNNKNSTAITFTSNGGIISESSPSSGYGRLQWNIRKGDAGPVFTIPFLNSNGQRVTFQFTANNIGQNLVDSGYVTVSTYPTPDVIKPNNRPLPSGVFNTDNECDGENSERLINRFWILEDGGYSIKPDLTLDFQYADVDFQGSNDAITENNLGSIKWNDALGKWIYPISGTLNSSKNQLSYRPKQNFSGVWTLSDTTPYPRAAFNFVGNCEKDSVAFTDKSGVTSDKIIQWQWSFGDGRFSGQQNPVHYYSPSGNFPVRLVIRSQSGCQDTAYKNALILAAPVAKFQLTDTCENSVVGFESFSWPGSGFIAGEYWDFGDGSSQEEGKKVQHYYGSVGLPDIRLIVYNSKGCKDTFLRQSYIAPKPYASVQFKNDCQYTPIQFSNGSTAGAGTITSYSWDFGNGKRSFNPSETVAYKDFGIFTVVFRVENSYGCSDTLLSPLEIYPRAIADFTFSPDEPKMLEPTLFYDNSKFEDRWEWDFGDGYFSTLENTAHSFETHNTYNVSLIASTQYGCADTITKPVTVRSIPLYWFPNAFTPANSEDRNDEFGLVTPLRITEFEFTIYNRWGQLIFKTNDPNEKWDGRYNGVFCQPGQYIYQATFKNPEKEIKVYKGTVNLLK